LNTRCMAQNKKGKKGKNHIEKSIKGGKGTDHIGEKSSQKAKKKRKGRRNADGVKETVFRQRTKAEANNHMHLRGKGEKKKTHPEFWGGGGEE